MIKLIYIILELKIKNFFLPNIQIVNTYNKVQVKHNNTFVCEFPNLYNAVTVHEIQFLLKYRNQILP
jgi:hypothetical protein